MKTTLKLLLNLALTLSLSINTVRGLSCLTCSDPNDSSCTTTVSRLCSTETQCVSATVVTTTSSGIRTQEVKSCAASDLCPIPSTQTFSLDVGMSSVLANVSCCNQTDDCNSASATTPTTPPAGSTTCYNCNPFTGQCSAGLSCNSLETKCITTSVIPPGGSTAMQAYGCASANLCAATASLSTSPLVINIGTIQGTPTCCDGSNCNDPTITTTTASPTTTTTTVPPTTTTVPTITTTTRVLTTTTTAPPTTTTIAPTTTTSSTTTTTTITTAPTTTTTSITTTTAAPASTITTTASATTTTIAATTSSTTTTSTASTTRISGSTTTAAASASTTASGVTTTTTTTNTTTTTTTTAGTSSLLPLALLHSLPLLLALLY